MVDPHLGRPGAGLELADIVRRFAPEYLASYGQAMMPSHKKALADIVACCTPERGGRLYDCADCHESFWHWTKRLRRGAGAGWSGYAGFDGRALRGSGM